MPIKFISAGFVTFEGENREKELYWASRPVRHSSPEEAQREAEHWATKTVAGRVIAGWELADKEDAEYKLKLEAKALSDDPGRERGRLCSPVVP